MGQKSSLPQLAPSVSQALMPDTTSLAPQNHQENARATEEPIGLPGRFPEAAAMHPA